MTDYISRRLQSFEQSIVREPTEFGYAWVISLKKVGNVKDLMK
jgi:hypothetical protein